MHRFSSKAGACLSATDANNLGSLAHHFAVNPHHLPLLVIGLPLTHDICCGAARLFALKTAPSGQVTACIAAPILAAGFCFFVCMYSMFIQNPVLAGGWEQSARSELQSLKKAPCGAQGFMAPADFPPIFECLLTHKSHIDALLYRQLGVLTQCDYQ